MRITVLILLVFCSLSVRAEFEYDQYLNKVVPGLDQNKTEFFKNLDHDAETLAWLEKVDALLKFGNYDASFFLNIGADGSITGIELEELRATDPEKFKSFIAKLISFKFPALPKDLHDTVFNLDARTLYLDRKLEIVDQEKKVLKEKIQFADFDTAELNLKLEEPRYIDYPAVGEELIFSSDDGSIIRTKVLEVHKDGMRVIAHQIKKGDQVNHLNLVFNVERPKNGSHRILKAALESSFAAATLAGAGASISSDGIMPGVFALMGMTGAVIEEHEKNRSFNFVRGDKISLTRLLD